MKHCFVTFCERRCVVYRARTCDEVNQLRRLIGETRVIMNVADRTSQYLVDAFEHDGFLCAVFVMDEPLTISGAQQAQLRALIKTADMKGEVQ